MRKKIIALGHEASLSGAPKLFLELLKELKKQDYDIIIFLKTGGDLLSDFSKIGKIFVLDSINKTNNPLFRLLIRCLPIYRIRDAYLKFFFARQNPVIVLNYTLVNSKLLPYLDRVKIPMLTVAQEMKGVISLFDKLKINNSKQIFERTNYFISCSKSVKDDLVEAYNINEKKSK